MTADTELPNRLIQALGRSGAMTIGDLAGEVSAPVEQVDAAVASLCGDGALVRDGERVGLSSSAENIAYESRQRLHGDEKRRIARVLAARIPNRASMFINIGTTTEEVAKALMGHTGLRVVTNNLNVATIMCVKRDFEVIVAGGIVRSRDRAVVGEPTVDLVRQFTVDFGIIGVSAIDERGGLLDFDYREVRVAQAIVEQSRNVFLATDHSKFARHAMVRLGHVSQLDVLFTDRAPPEAVAAQLAAANVEVVLAEAAP